MPMTTTPEEAKASILVTRHNEYTKRLADVLFELGEVRAAIARHQKAAWESTQGLGITERREEVKHAHGDLIAEAEKLLGEVEATRAFIANVEFQMQYLEGNNGRSS